MENSLHLRGSGVRKLLGLNSLKALDLYDFEEASFF